MNLIKYVIFLFSLICTSSHAKDFDLATAHKCINAMRKIVTAPQFHTRARKSPRLFKGKFQNQKGIYFEDRRGNFLFVAKKEVQQPKVIYLPNKEYYSLKLKNKEIVITQINQKLRGIDPIIALPVQDKIDFQKAYQNLIRNYGDEVITLLKAKEKRKKKSFHLNPDGLIEYKALKVCEVAANKMNFPSLQQYLQVKMKQIPDYSEIQVSTKKSTK